jgi:signal transduction histidine kinase
MNSIRSSVHDLHNESIDLYSQLYALYWDFKFCPLAFDYEVNKAPPVKMVYSVIAIVKEALANIIKHSDATAAALTFRELPGFYQLIITDNGPKKDYSQSGGIGIVNIKARVEA